MLLQTVVHASTTQGFMCAVARCQEFKSPNQSFAVPWIHFLPPGRFAYFNQSGNHAHTLAPHCGSAAADDLKTDKQIVITE